MKEKYRFIKRRSGKTPSFVYKKKGYIKRTQIKDDERKEEEEEKEKDKEREEIEKEMEYDVTDQNNQLINNYYELLNIDQTSCHEDIISRWKMFLILAPDKLQKQMCEFPEIEEHVNVIFSKIINARKVLLNKKARETYDDLLSNNVLPSHGNYYACDDNALRLLTKEMESKGLSINLS